MNYTSNGIVHSKSAAAAGVWSAGVAGGRYHFLTQLHGICVNMMMAHLAFLGPALCVFILPVSEAIKVESKL